MLYIDILLKVSLNVVLGKEFNLTETIQQNTDFYILLMKPNRIIFYITGLMFLKYISL